MRNSVRNAARAALILGAVVLPASAALAETANAPSEGPSDAAKAAAALEARSGAVLFGDAERQALRYSFSTENQQVGTAEGEIVRIDEKTWRVRARYEIVVDVLGLELYDLEMTVRERYRGARLVFLDIESTENGEKHRVTGKAEGAVFAYTHNGEAHEAPADIVPSTKLWRRGMLARTRVVHAVKGKLFDRSAEPLGTKTFATPDGEQPLEGMHVDTPYETADLWYDDSGLLERAVLDRMGLELIIRRQPKP